MMMTMKKKTKYENIAPKGRRLKWFAALFIYVMEFLLLLLVPLTHQSASIVAVVVVIIVDGFDFFFVSIPHVMLDGGAKQMGEKKKLMMILHSMYNFCTIRYTTLSPAATHDQVPIWCMQLYLDLAIGGDWHSVLRASERPLSLVSNVYVFDSLVFVCSYGIGRWSMVWCEWWVWWFERTKSNMKMHKFFWSDERAREQFMQSSYTHNMHRHTSSVFVSFRPFVSGHGEAKNSDKFDSHCFNTLCIVTGHRLIRVLWMMRDA